MSTDPTPAEAANQQPAIAPIVWSASQVAAALGLSRASFDRKRTELYQLGFPTPVPGLTAKWSVLAVQAWVAATPVDAWLSQDVAIDQIRRQLEDELA